MRERTIISTLAPATEGRLPFAPAAVPALHFNPRRLVAGPMPEAMIAARLGLPMSHDRPVSTSGHRAHARRHDLLVAA